MYGVGGGTPTHGVRHSVAYPAMKAQLRCVWATPRRPRCSSTFSAKSWTRSTSVAVPGLLQKDASWALECALIAHLEKIWDQPDDGIWEVRGGPKHFTHLQGHGVGLPSTVRCARRRSSIWQGPLDRWRRIRAAIHKDVCDRGFDSAQNSFVQSYGATSLDASLLMIPIVGFFCRRPTLGCAGRWRLSSSA